jgi:glucose/arabinose dehydrogenase
VVVLLAGCSAGQAGGSAPSAPAPSGLRVEQVASGLVHGWDVGFLPGGQILVTERPGKLALVSGGKVTDVRADFSDVLVKGEGGLMGVVVHPDFATSRKFTTCQTHEENDRAVDIRLVTWQLSQDGTSAERVKNPLLGGLPVNPSGRHSGCRPTLAHDGSLLVGTGDTANASIAQNRQSLGGKVLRLDLNTGDAAPGNPFADASDAAERRIYTYGHRNVQGVAPRPGSDQVFTTEHGPTADDEVNLLRAGANYGWDPSRGGTVGGYDEDVPMTDLRRFPDAVPAVWASGSPTDAICGAAFLAGPNWHDMNGVLAVTALKGAELLLFTLTADGKVESVSVPPELKGRYGRLRAARLGPDGGLYVTTSNGTDDVLLRITRG